MVLIWLDLPGVHQQSWSEGEDADQYLKTYTEIMAGARRIPAFLGEIVIDH